MLALAIVLVAGCATNQPKPEPRPHWVDNPGDVTRGLAAVGVAAKSRADARDKATAEARGALARAVKTQIKAVVEVYNQSSNARDVSEVDTATFAYSQVNLAHSIVRSTYVDDKNFYALVVLSDPGDVMRRTKAAIVQAGGEEAAAGQAVDEMLVKIESGRKEIEARGGQ